MPIASIPALSAVQLEMTLEYYEDDSTNTSTQNTCYSDDCSSTSRDIHHQHVFSYMEISLNKSNNHRKLTVGELARQNIQCHSVELKEGSLIPTEFNGVGNHNDETAASAAYSAAYDSIEKSIISVDEDLALYHVWFGEATPERVDTVKKNYLAMQIAMESTQYALYFHGRACVPKFYAYSTYGDKVIYLCDLYYQAPPTGANSKMGTIVHEMSHVVANTYDGGNGAKACKELTQDDAINNADCYQFFSEAQ